MGLAAVSDAGGHKILEILFTALDSDFLSSASKVMSPLLECSDDCKDFFVVDIIIDLGSCKLLRIEGYGVKLVIDVVLG